MINYGKIMRRGLARQYFSPLCAQQTLGEALLLPWSLPDCQKLRSCKETGDMVQEGKTQGHLFQRKVGAKGTTKAFLILARIPRPISHQNLLAPLLTM